MFETGMFAGDVALHSVHAARSSQDDGYVTLRSPNKSHNVREQSIGLYLPV